MFGHKHYVPILKGKRGEFNAITSLKSVGGVTPLFEAIPSQPPTSIPTQLSKCGWSPSAPYFADLIFFDDDNSTSNDPPLQQVLSCINAARSKGQSIIPVTGTGRSPAYQRAMAQSANVSGMALRLIPDDFEDEDDLRNAIDALLGLVKLQPNEVDLIVDLGSVADQNASVIRAIHRANLEMVPDISSWRTVTVAAGAFPLSLATLDRNVWNRVSRVDWIAWSGLRSAAKHIARLPSYGDYTIAHPGLPPEGRATILAQLRYSTEDAFMIWKGNNAVKHGFDQFFSICGSLIQRQEYRGAQFSEADSEIQAKATSGDSPGNAETWRKLGTNHHIETVLDQIANLP